MDNTFAHPSEASYARLLDEHGIPWEYEPHTFLLERLFHAGPHAKLVRLFRSWRR